MKILISGSNGYLGARLSQFLSQAGHEIIGVCHSRKSNIKDWESCLSKLIIADLTDYNSIEKLSSLQIDTIIHMVSLNDIDSSQDIKKASDVNVLMTWRLLEQFVPRGLKSFIYFSTIHVYDSHNQNNVTEKTRTSPKNIYGLTHLLSENICNYYHKNFDTQCINVRLSNSYGEPIFPDAKCWNLIVNNLTRSAYVNKRIVLKSDGKQMRDFIHFSDICIGVGKLIKLSKKIGSNNTFHFCSSQSISMRSIAFKIQAVHKQIYGDKIPIFINTNQVYDKKNKIEKSKKTFSNDLAYHNSIVFKKELKEGIKDLFNYFENQ